jgi:hypothetical protein
MRGVGRWGGGAGVGWWKRGTNVSRARGTNVSRARGTNVSWARGTNVSKARGTNVSRASCVGWEGGGGWVGAGGVGDGAGPPDARRGQGERGARPSRPRPANPPSPHQPRAPASGLAPVPPPPTLSVPPSPSLWEPLSTHAHARTLHAPPHPARLLGPRVTPRRPRPSSCCAATCLPPPAPPQPAPPSSDRPDRPARTSRGPGKDSVSGPGISRRREPPLPRLGRPHAVRCAVIAGGPRVPPQPAPGVPHTHPPAAAAAALALRVHLGPPVRLGLPCKQLGLIPLLESGRVDSDVWGSAARSGPARDCAARCTPPHGGSRQ